MSLNRALAVKIEALYTETVAKSVEGNSTNFAELHDPSEENFRKFMNSIAFFYEEEARAKNDSISALQNKAGLVTIATDVQAKANDDGEKSDRTVMPTSKHLPTVVANDSQIVGALNDILLAIEVDSSILTRNEFKVRLNETFRAWLDTLRTEVTNNTSNIAEIGTPTSAPVWNTLDSTFIELYHIGSLASVWTPGTATIANWDATGSTNQSYINYYIIGDVIHFKFRLDFKVTFSPTIGTSRTQPGVFIRVAISPPTGETFIQQKGGSCLLTTDASKPGLLGLSTSMNIGNFTAADTPIRTTTHVDGEKIFFGTNMEFQQSGGERVMYTGEFTARLA
jgi:hypothetical protein